MVELADMARECGGIRSGSFDTIKQWTFSEAGLAEFAARIRAACPPDWKGYALLGDPARTGGYVMEHSAAPPDPELGAEFIIRPATEKDRDGGRKVGETRATDGSPIQPETMAIRIGFLNAAALDALEAQLRILREENFPGTSGVSRIEDQAPCDHTPMLTGKGGGVENG